MKKFVKFSPDCPVRTISIGDATPSPADVVAVTKHSYCVYGLSPVLKIAN